MPTIKDSSSIEEVLQYIVACYGAAIYQEKQRLSNLIADLYTGEERLKRLYRRMVMEDAVSQQLYSISLKPIQEREGFYNRLVYQFKEANFYEEAFARQVLDVFLHGMNLLLVEPISTKATKEDGEWYDEYGVKYSADQKKLISAQGRLYGNYSVLDGTIVICDYAFLWCEDLRGIALPSSVTNIGNGAFSSCRYLREITLPPSVTSIGDGAFLSCENLREITLPSSVTNIGDRVFSSCRNLREITLLPSVTGIGNEAFRSCKNLCGITIPSSVTSIGDSAFCWCENLKEINIPSSVISIGYQTFSSCSNLQRINVAESNKFYKTIDGVLYTKDLKTIICYPEGKENGSFVIPLGVTSIGNSAFSSCENLREIIIPSTVTSIGDYAFYGCSNLQEIIIPSTVTSIGKRAFGFYKNLCEITLPASVTSIGRSAFLGCKNLCEITLSANVMSIGDDAFEWCENLERINIPAGTLEKFKKLLPGWAYKLHEV